MIKTKESQLKIEKGYKMLEEFLLCRQMLLSASEVSESGVCHLHHVLSAVLLGHLWLGPLALAALAALDSSTLPKDTRTIFYCFDGLDKSRRI